jgi:hypothetical protein
MATVADIIAAECDRALSVTRPRLVETLHLSMPLARASLVEVYEDSTLVFFLIGGGGVAFALSLRHFGVAPIGLFAVGLVAVVVAAIVAAAIRIASPWDRVVVLRLGKFRALKGPGLFGIIPIVDTIPYWIDDHRRTRLVLASQRVAF